MLSIRLVTFDNKQSAELAVKELNAKELDGRNVHIRLDRNFTNDFDEQDNSNNNTIPVFVGNLPWSLNSDDLTAYFKDCVPVNCNLLTNMYGKSRGFAIVNFNNIIDAERAISIVNGLQINGRTIEVRNRYIIILFALILAPGYRFSPYHCVFVLCMILFPVSDFIFIH